MVTNCPPDAGWHTLIDRDIVVVARDEPGWWEAVTGLELSVCYFMFTSELLLLNTYEIVTSEFV